MQLNINKDGEILREGFWWSSYEQHLPKAPSDAPPFKDQQVVVRLFFLLQRELERRYQSNLKKFEERYELWRDTTALQDRVNNVDCPVFEPNPDDEFAVDCYRGSSRCRICGTTNGSREFEFAGYRWPQGYLHYVEEHNVEPSQGFKDMLGRASLWLQHSE